MGMSHINLSFLTRNTLQLDQHHYPDLYHQHHGLGQYKERKKWKKSEAILKHQKRKKKSLNRSVKTAHYVYEKSTVDSDVLMNMTIYMNIHLIPPLLSCHQEIRYSLLLFCQKHLESLRKHWGIESKRLSAYLL